jgi:hypothetical protein
MIPNKMPLLNHSPTKCGLKPPIENFLRYDYSSSAKPLSDKMWMDFGM